MVEFPHPPPLTLGYYGKSMLSSQILIAKVQPAVYPMIGDCAAVECEECFKVEARMTMTRALVGCWEPCCAAIGQGGCSAPRTRPLTATTILPTATCIPCLVLLPPCSIHHIRSSEPWHGWHFFKIQCWTSITDLNYRKNQLSKSLLKYPEPSL